MKESFYYDGTQIKNYLIGFASVFSEIPYKKRNGKITSVPIHYGSPSDIISYLEMNVDNADTRNRNRLKDVSVPIFSFRMVGMERNSERRRAPLDTIAVDLRPLGYSTGYVAMRPAPFKFTMELVLWASSDYQAFEIVEQIVPYFNSPQQVNIEPLPRCPVSVTEIHLENFEIETDPEAQKYSALVTMTFSMTGWLLSQPRVWSTNMQFELSMLDKENLENIFDPDDDTYYGVGHEIIDTNLIKPKTTTDLSLETVENFVKLTSLNEIYGDKLAWYDSLVKAGRIAENGDLISHDELTIQYKGTEKILYPATIDMLIDDMADVLYLYENAQFKESLATHSIEDSMLIVNTMLVDETNSIDIFMTLLDNNLVTRGFNRTDVEITNSDKLNLFGTSRIDIDDVLLRLRSYLAAIENLKLNNIKMESLGYLSSTFNVYSNRVIAPFETIPTEYTNIEGNDIDMTISDLKYISFEYDEIGSKLNIKMETEYVSPGLEEIDLTVVFDDGSSIKTEHITANIVYGKVLFSITATPDVAFVINVIVEDNYSNNIHGLFINTSTNIPDPTNFNIFDSEYKITPNLVMSDNYFKLFNKKMLLEDKFLNLDMYVVASLIYNQYDLEKEYSYDEYLNGTLPLDKLLQSDLYGKYTSKYASAPQELLTYRNALKHITSVVSSVLTSNPESIGNATQKKIAPDLAVVLATDNDGNPIYDVNNDGYINLEDLTILESNVDNPEDFDHEIKYGVWYKRFHPENISPEELLLLKQSIKQIDVISKKQNMDIFSDYIILFKKGYVTNDFNISAEPIKRREVEALGYNLVELDEGLLEYRNYIHALETIFVSSKGYMLSYVPDLTEENFNLYNDFEFKTEILVKSKLVGRYLAIITDEDLKLIEETKLREIITDLWSSTFGEYLNVTYKFNVIWLQIKATNLYAESLLVELPAP